MGTAARIKPQYLSKKLLAIRNGLNLSQTDIARKLSDDKIVLRRSDIARFEIGLREPSLIVVWRYAQLAKITIEMLVDDSVTL